MAREVEEGATRGHRRLLLPPTRVAGERVASEAVADAVDVAATATGGILRLRTRD